jgi:hypothetical protein
MGRDQTSTTIGVSNDIREQLREIQETFNLPTMGDAVSLLVEKMSGKVKKKLAVYLYDKAHGKTEESPQNSTMP